MVTLSEAIERRFPLDDEWARLALGTLGDMSAEAAVHDIGQGWLRVGGDAGVLVDTLFVLTEERLGFGQTQAETGQPNWIELTKVVALDAIEGLPYPLVAVEVQLNGGIAMLVGWPDEFCDQVVEVLTRSVQRAHEAQQAADGGGEKLPPEFADPAGSAEHADMSEMETMSPSTWVESPVADSPVAPSPVTDSPVAASPFAQPPVEPQPVAAASPWDRSPWATDTSTTPAVEAPDDAVDASEDTVDVPEDAVESWVDDSVEDAEHRPEAAFEAEAPQRPAGFLPLFDAGEAEHDERVEAFFNPDEVEAYVEPTDTWSDDGEPPSLWAPPSPEDRADGLDGPEGLPTDEPAAPRTATPAAFASRLIAWPEPFRPTTFLGDHPDHSRRRKNVSLAFSPAGITAVSTGFNAWKLHLLWDDVRNIEFEGADEVKFTHNHRIDMNGTAVIVTLTDGSVMVFEVRSRRPAMMRSTMAPIVNALASHRATLSGSDEASGHGSTFTF